MSEKDIQEKIQRSYERYCSYDLKVWTQVFFDEKTGGYVVVDLRRIEHSQKSNSERTKYTKEFEMAKVFSRDGHQIEMLEEDDREMKYDVNINGMEGLVFLHWRGDCV